ncbi:hypothetical protein NSK_001017 [Nannochloropsis salina CCMP1776]|uniref:asparagine--tRNA ligase n=1 Tax=Nannochloropsis salina CCMP1776 TaxID=1027361 RepID=A0A4D9DB93_9STRA|nr:hypothetical protein NSK_001017 [Nannochloropsis salina CCMP1776]|eukprot:TFJ87667.1 hypothetical protein NSK_001017 [Nannochloropsis salina CCMP1776]
MLLLQLQEIPAAAPSKRVLDQVRIIATLCARTKLARQHFPPCAIQSAPSCRPPRLLVSPVSTSTTLYASSSTAAPSTSTATTVPARLKVRDILINGDDSLIGQRVTVKGWTRTIRSQKTFSFIEINDGSSLGGLQVVADAEKVCDYEAVLSKIHTGAALGVVGVIKASPGKGQKYEVAAESVEVVGGCDPEAYPLQKKRHTLEFLRGIAHLRPRTNTLAAVARVRSALAFATHKFFQEQGFYYLQSPIITASDCEGAGEMFRVTTLPGKVSELPRVEGEEDRIDYSQDFFGAPAYLTVSGQLSGEAYACAMGDVYTFGPTFRAENSQTTRHLAEFNMIEPEMAFADLQDNMRNAEAYVKAIVRHVLKECEEDLAFFEKFYDKTLMARLKTLVSESFARVEYTEAVRLLQEEIAKDRGAWQFPDVDFGTDLQTEHERWLCEKKFQRATFVYNYPREIKAFYMRDNEDGKTVAAMDLLVPGVGELIGGSQREERLGRLEAKLEEFGLDKEDYWWYLDLRRFGSVPHSGYGLGFERLVCYVTGVENIREAIAFPRTPGSATF